MNQILDYMPNGGGSNQSGGSDKIVRVFAIILIIFAVVLIAVVGYGKFSNKKEMNEVTQQETYANITVEVEGAEATIQVTHDKNIQKLIYSWDGSDEKTVSFNEKYAEKTIGVPTGDNTLHVKVIDENGVETTLEKEISIEEEGLDIINPVIELSSIEGNKWQIKATDETALDYITYRWNEDEEQTIYAEENNNDKEITAEIEILKGKNDLTVVAVDKNKNTTTEIKSFTGVTKPEITVTLSEDGSSINIKAEHENGLESVSFNFNNRDYNIDIGDENPKMMQFDQNLEVGYNRIIIKVKSVDGTETTFDGQCNYGVASNETTENTTSEETTTEENVETSEEE